MGDTVDSLDDIEQKDIDIKMESINVLWRELRNAVQKRISLATSFIQFLHLADHLSEKFRNVETMLKSTPEDAKLNQLNIYWDQIKPIYSQLKKEGNQFLANATKVK